MSEEQESLLVADSPSSAATSHEKTGAAVSLDQRERESHRIEEIRRARDRLASYSRAIDTYYDEIPVRLRDHPDAQSRCLELLSNAEVALTPPVGRKSLIQSRLDLTRLQIEMTRTESAKTSFLVVVMMVYIFSALAGTAVTFDLVDLSSPASQLNQQLVMGIPKPVWVWAIIGSFTSMLLRAGSFPFSNRIEAIRWLLFRPVLGVVMGVMTYLMLTAWLIVFAGSSTTQTSELIWVIAFVGSFSDTLSVNLLQKVIGHFEPQAKSEEVEAPAAILSK